MLLWYWETGRGHGCGLGLLPLRPRVGKRSCRRHGSVQESQRMRRMGMLGRETGETAQKEM